jgi:hypothetical protein
MAAWRQLPGIPGGRMAAACIISFPALITRSWRICLKLLFMFCTSLAWTNNKRLKYKIWILITRDVGRRESIAASGMAVERPRARRGDWRWRAANPRSCAFGLDESLITITNPPFLKEVKERTGRNLRRRISNIFGFNSY